MIAMSMVDVVESFCFINFHNEARKRRKAESIQKATQIFVIKGNKEA